MEEIRLHGRGGQGAVVASKILATAAFLDGMEVQSFPTFGVERRGAPVAAFVRFSKSKILIRSAVYTPKYVVVLDPTLLIGSLDIIMKGLQPNGAILINTKDDITSFNFDKQYKLATVDAAGIAVRNKIGTVTTPIVNTAITGAFAKATGLVTIDSVLEAIRKNVPVKAEANVKAAREAFEETKCSSCSIEKVYS
ncbi:2-oxoacid:acceptor oxidoreductase family protein [Candidatus Peregrinibacteria bacterium]|nr:2-oxoacid:acceptor oxidoreductase family protein [Candidatus Peregrinibacteria bacterium]